RAGALERHDAARDERRADPGPIHARVDEVAGHRGEGHLQREANVVWVRERAWNEESTPLLRAGSVRVRVAGSELVAEGEGGPLHLAQLGEGRGGTARVGGSRGGVAIER